MINEIAIKNKVTELSYRFNDYDATFLIDEGSIDWGEVSATHNTYSYPEQLGEFISSTVIGTRTISICGWIVGRGSDIYTDLKCKKNLLNRFISPLQEVIITVKDYCITGNPDSQVRYSNTYEENNDVMCKFIFTVLCANPVFEPINPIALAVTSNIPKFRFPLTFIAPGILFGVRDTSLISHLKNTGINAVGVLITFVANGVVNNPKLINISTQEFLKINATLNKDDVVIINTCNGNRYVSGTIAGIEQNYFSHLDLDSSWLQFNPGISDVSFTTDVDGVQDDTYKNLLITITYKPNLFNLEEE